MTFTGFWIYAIFYLFPTCSTSFRSNIKSDHLLSSLQQSNYTLQFSALVSELIRKSMVQYCCAIIVDQYHEDIWQKTFFSDQFHPITYFKIKVDESEDLLNPDYKTVRVLKEIKKKNCDFIIIFILNGIQSKRFLMFMDESRNLNTRSKYVLLYDHRIFQRDLHYIWRRILSVVFIRTIESRVGFREPNKIGFELLTVPFPNALKGIFVGKNLGVWLNGKLTEKNNLFYDKSSNLQNLELRVVVYEHIPMVLKRENAINKFFGVEVEIVEAIAKIMNFTIRFYQSADADGEKWGRKLLNDSFTGLLGEMVLRQADIAIADLHLSIHHLNLMDLSIPHSSECLTFLTPESTADNSWKTFIMPLSGNMWTGVLVSLLLVGSIFYTISFVHRSIIYGRPISNPFAIFKMKRQKRVDFKNAKNYIQNNNRLQEPILHSDIFDSFSDCLLLTYSMLLQVSLPRMPFHWPLRILTGWYWIYCIQVVVIYRASLTAILANPSPRITVDTLDELADSSLIIGAWGDQNREFFNTAFDDTAQKIATKLEQIDDPDQSVVRIASGKYAYYDNVYFLRHLRLERTNNVEASVDEVLHIMKECVLNVPVSIGLEKNSPLKPNIDKYLRRLIEGGLIEKWLRDSTKNLAAEEEPPPEALMDLKKFWSSLAALIIGYFIGALALIGELLHFKYIVKRHPMYDRYNPRAYYIFMKSRN